MKMILQLLHICFFVQVKSDMFNFLKDSQHRKRLKHLNIEDDIRFCLQLNKSKVVPILIKDKLVPIY